MTDKHSKDIKKMNLDALENVAGGATRPRKAPEIQGDYMPDDYMINGITLYEAINMLNERALSGMEAAIELANGVLYPHESWRRFYSGGIETVTRMMFEYHYHNY